jgi:NADP-dependent 3-hydroxy acid dehydrogenase YdfG
MNKVVLTGGSSGIGKSWKFFTQQGFIVYGTSRNPGGYNSVFPLVALDVRDTASIHQLLLKLYLYQGLQDT